MGCRLVRWLLSIGSLAPDPWRSELGRIGSSQSTMVESIGDAMVVDDLEIDINGKVGPESWSGVGLGLRLGLGFRVKTGSPSPLPTPAPPSSGDITRGILLGGMSPDGVASSRRRIRVVGVIINSAGIVPVVVSVASIVLVAGIVSCTAVVSIVVLSGLVKEIGW